MQRRPGRALLAGMILAAGLVTTTGPAAAAEPDPATARVAAARWLAEEHRWDPDRFHGYKVATEVLLAWAASGTEREAADALDAWLVANIGTIDDLDGTDGFRALDALGRALPVLVAYGHDPGAVGGRDVEADLRAQMIADGPDAGRFRERLTSTTPSTNVALHARAVLALAATDDGAPPAAVAALRAAQCPDGSFRGTFGSSLCTRIEGTALATVALTVAGVDQAAADAATAGGAWLAGQQQPDGSILQSGIGVSSAILGWATAALRATGQGAAADALAGYLTTLALEIADGVRAIDAGAIASVPNRHADAVTAGRIDLSVRLTQWRDATPGAVVGLQPTAPGTWTRPPAGSPPPPPPGWRAGPCDVDEGVTTIIDPGPLAAAVEVRCALGDQPSAYASLTNAGWAPTSLEGTGTRPCTIGGLPIDGPASCSTTTGSWLAFRAPDGEPGTTWSPLGIPGTTEVSRGQVLGFRFGEPSAGLPPRLGPHVPIDTTAPVVEITASPDPVTPETAASVTFTVDDATATVECRLDGGAWAGCTSPWTATGLAVGAHEVVVRAVDAAGNEGTDTYSWTIRAVRSAEEAWVWAAYEDFLDRVPTPSEVSAAVVRLDGGTPRSTLARELATSEEWLSVIVTRFYADTLGREPSGEEVDYWTGQLASGRRTVATVAASFYGSAEYVDRAGGTYEEWIGDLYDALLGRPASSDDVVYWSGQATARGRGRVALQMFQSLESRRARVERLYEDLLGRVADAGGRDYWAGRLTKEGDIALARDLAASTEYLTRAQGRHP